MKIFHQQWNDQVVHFICAKIDQLPSHQATLKQAMKLAVQSGGKRIRPFFVINAARIANGQLLDALPVAAAIEMIHTYSLIHDDLPALDNDDLRRGLPTLHIAFDEATAILAGDAFLTLAFEVLTQVPISAVKKIAIIQLFSHCAGGSGMIAGQMLDIEAEDRVLTLEQLQQLHLEKTGKLFDAAILAGLFFGEVCKQNQQLMKQFSTHFGLAFQIHNDLQDALWDSNRSGKTTKRDQSLAKNTYVSLLTVDGAMQALAQEKKAAQEALEQLVLDNEEQKQARASFVASLAYLDL